MDPYCYNSKTVFCWSILLASSSGGDGGLDMHIDLLRGKLLNCIFLPFSYYLNSYCFLCGYNLLSLFSAGEQRPW
jgi:hypothetical protein